MLNWLNLFLNKYKNRKPRQSKELRLKEFKEYGLFINLKQLKFLQVLIYLKN